jgi:GAF domain-containing protein
MRGASSINMHEAARVETVRRLASSEGDFDWLYQAVAALTGFIMEAPVAKVSFIDDKNQVVRAAVGTGTTQIPREIAICNWTIGQSDAVIVEDTTKDERFVSHPMVVSGPQVRSYAGAPVWAEGFNIGAVCAVGFAPRPFTESQRQCILLLASIVAKLVVLERSIREAKEPVTGQPGVEAA